MNIQTIHGVIDKITDLSPTAKEITIELDSPLTFLAGAFVNLFLEDGGEKIRRAFSISSDAGTKDSLTLSIRESLQGRMSPLFWKQDMLGKSVKVMGPLGKNTADKMRGTKIFLFGFGIGVGVVKSLAAHFANRPDIESITISTGSHNNEDVMYQEYFKILSEKDARIQVRHVVSQNDGTTHFPVGYIQNYIDDMDFNNSNVYVCGQEIACTLSKGPSPQRVQRTVVSLLRLFIETPLKNFFFVLLNYCASKVSSIF
ncbi:MAG: FAD-dependent oxidoreductase [Candidatus Pacebacteria bacterium]|nr:FAD-dependent oxidoreductase [Candidatus Paceibacterota bacterium]MCF7857687.1 FAD-dependent oxidoreductase [Candidatus Paceibacterota bacterium]